MSRLKVNFTQDEADSKARGVLPTGEYNVSIVDVKTTEVKPGSPNVGKPYWSIRFVVQDGKYADQSAFSNIMLFSTEKPGTLSTLSQFLKAIGYEISAGEFELPDDEEIQGKTLTIVGRKFPAGPDRRTGKDLPERFQVTGFKADGAGPAKTANQSMLP
jgi:hypothetical protein